MSLLIQGSVRVKAKELNLDLTLLGGQSFRWQKRMKKEESQWLGAAYGAYWILTQDENNLFYQAYKASNASQPIKNQKYFDELLQRYLRLDFDLSEQVKQWRKSHTHFDKLAPYMKAVRVLNQEPLENILSFICSQNNNIKRISTMIQWLCTNYGEKIGNFDSNDVVYDFPKLESFINTQDTLEERLRCAKFGYRAKFIAQSVAKINEFGGLAWFEKLRALPYQEARQELVKLPGIGFKVADCICLMSLGHLESVPIDTHIFKIAQTVYMPQLAGVKAVTPKIYEEIADNFRKIYGPFAGWTQAVLFCSELQQFQINTVEDKTTSSSHSKKKRKK